jgi:hypothetical protein
MPAANLEDAPYQLSPGCTAAAPRTLRLLRRLPQLGAWRARVLGHFGDGLSTQDPRQNRRSISRSSRPGLRTGSPQPAARSPRGGPPLWRRNSSSIPQRRRHVALGPLHLERHAAIRLLGQAGWAGRVMDQPSPSGGPTDRALPPQALRLGLWAPACRARRLPRLRGPATRSGGPRVVHSVACRSGVGGRQANPHRPRG